MQQNKTIEVMTKTPVIDISGHVLFNQCRPKIRYCPAKLLFFPTPHDIEQKLLHNLRIIKITRGE